MTDLQLLAFKREQARRLAAMQQNAKRYKHKEQR